MAAAPSAVPARISRLPSRTSLPTRASPSPAAQSASTAAPVSRLPPGTASFTSFRASPSFRHPEVPTSSSSPPIASTSQVPYDPRPSPDPRVRSTSQQAPPLGPRHASVTSSTSSLPRRDSPAASLGSPPSQRSASQTPAFSPTDNALQRRGEEWRWAIPLRLYYHRGRGSPPCFLVMEGMMDSAGDAVRSHLFIAEGKETGARVLLRCIEADTVIIKPNVPSERDHMLLLRFTFTARGKDGTVKESRITCLMDTASPSWLPADCAHVFRTMFPDAKQVPYQSQLTLLMEVEAACPDLVTAEQRTVIHPVKFYSYTEEDSPAGRNHTAGYVYDLVYCPSVGEHAPAFALVEKDRRIPPIRLYRSDIQHLKFPVENPELLEMGVHVDWAPTQPDILRILFDLKSRDGSVQGTAGTRIFQSLKQINAAFSNVDRSPFAAWEQARFVATLNESFELLNNSILAYQAQQQSLPPHLSVSSAQHRQVPPPSSQYRQTPPHLALPVSTSFAAALFVALRICVINGESGPMKLPDKSLSFVQEFDAARHHVTVSVVCEAQEWLKCTTFQGNIFAVELPGDDHQLALSFTMKHGPGGPRVVECVFDHRHPSWTGAVLSEMSRRFAHVAQLCPIPKMTVRPLKLDAQLSILAKLEKAEREVTKRQFPDAYIPPSETLTIPLRPSARASPDRSVFHLYGSFYSVHGPDLPVSVWTAEHITHISIELGGESGSSLDVNIRVRCPNITRADGIPVIESHRLPVSDGLRSNARKELLRRIRECYSTAFSDTPPVRGNETTAYDNNYDLAAAPASSSTRPTALQSLKRARSDLNDAIGAGVGMQERNRFRS